MKYAPVGIITLHRYKHLKRCITSLQNNSWAKYTDLYISVDYSTNENYLEGNHEIISYLKSGIEGFANVYFFYQDRNLGTMENLTFIYHEVFKKFDRIIVLEDDNELSPNFIEFCDKGLELFEHNETVIGINASNYVWCGKGFIPKSTKIIAKDENNVVKRQLVWHGFATWKSEYEKLEKICSTKEYCLYGKNFSKMIKLCKSSKSFFYSYLWDVLCTRKQKLPWNNNKIYAIDSVWDTYMFLFDKYMICPVNGMTRDWGMDGSGANFLVEADNCNDILNNQLDDHTTFHFQLVKPLEVEKHEVELHDRYGSRSFVKRCAIMVAYILHLLNVIRI